MGRLDELKNKAKEMVSENREKIEGGLEKAGEMVNQKTGGKYEDKIDKGLAKAQEGLDRVEGNAEGSSGTGMSGGAGMAEGAGMAAAPGMSEGAGMAEPDMAGPTATEMQETPPTTPPPAGPPMG